MDAVINAFDKAIAKVDSQSCSEAGRLLCVKEGEVSKQIQSMLHLENELRQFRADLSVAMAGLGRGNQDISSLTQEQVQHAREEGVILHNLIRIRDRHLPMINLRLKQLKGLFDLKV